MEDTLDHLPPKKRDELARAADIIHEATLAVRLGLPVQDLARTVHTYPTISDGLHLAALENIRQQRAKPGPVTTWQTST